MIVFCPLSSLKAHIYVLKQYPLPQWSPQLTSLAITICFLALAACAPLPPKPGIVKQDSVTILPIEVIIDEKSNSQAPEETVENQLDNKTEISTEPSIQISDGQEATEITSEIVPEDNRTQTNIVAFSAPKPINPKTLLTKPLKPEPPKTIAKAPDPLDPYIFLEKSQSYLHSIIGKPDMQFTEQGVLIAQYKEASCQLLAFLASDQSEARVIHIDVRPALLDSALHIESCYQAFGKRADDIDISKAK